MGIDPLSFNWNQLKVPHAPCKSSIHSAHLGLHKNPRKTKMVKPWKITASPEKEPKSFFHLHFGVQNVLGQQLSLETWRNCSVHRSLLWFGILARYSPALYISPFQAPASMYTYYIYIIPPTETCIDISIIIM